MEEPEDLASLGNRPTLGVVRSGRDTGVTEKHEASTHFQFESRGLR
jgi:hypothetical protein